MGYLVLVAIHSVEQTAFFDGCPIDMPIIGSVRIAMSYYQRLALDLPFRTDLNVVKPMAINLPFGNYFCDIWE